MSIDKFHNKEQITAKVIADSISPDGKRLTTFELEYPRLIHSEFMTHRVFSRNAASSRAIPFDKVAKQVLNSPAMPVYWGLNKAGMQASDEEADVTACEKAWKLSAIEAVHSAKRLKEEGVHKQVINRILEPFQLIKVVCTATEWDNFFKLRLDSAAQPEIQVLAYKMQEALFKSKPKKLDYGEWHLPYVDKRKKLSTEVAKKVSVSCCAQVSYRKLDNSLEKAERIYNMLVTADIKHLSPFEHIATPCDGSSLGNLDGWTQLRHSIEEGCF